MQIQKNFLEEFSLPDANLGFYPQVFKLKDSMLLFDDLKNQMDWDQYSIRIFDKQIPQPRLMDWCSDSGVSYTYSGVTLQPKPWNQTLLRIKAKVESVSGSQFNHALLNFYRHGQDGMGWHSDDERELGKNPVIASLSLGETRTFQLKHKFNSRIGVQKIELHSGSLLLMRGQTQHFWKHQVPKTKRQIKPRINITFRRVNKEI